MRNFRERLPLSRRTKKAGSFLTENKFLTERETTQPNYLTQFLSNLRNYFSFDRGKQLLWFELNFKTEKKLGGTKQHLDLTPTC